VRIEDGVTHDALWATEFKRDSREASDLPLEIAARIADEANIVIFARGANPSLTDNSALSALLQVADMIRDPPNGAWAQMIDRAQGLVARNPKFAFGHDVLAAAYAEAAQAIDVPDRSKAMSDAALREGNLTLKLDPEDAGAYVVLSDLQPAYDYRTREAILLRGIKVAKHPKEPLGGLYSSEGRLLDSVGRLRESLSLKLVAHATDEWGAPKTAQLARAYANMGDLPEARAWLAKGVQLWPNHSGIWRVRQYVAGFYEQPSDALAIFNSLDEQVSAHQSNATWRIYVNAKAAHSADLTDAAVSRIIEAADEGKVPREIAIMMIAGLGKTEQAIEAANSALDHNRALDAWFLFTPVTRNMRQDPAFVGLASRLGLIKYWRETGKRPDFCTEQARPSECSPQTVGGAAIVKRLKVLSSSSRWRR
jgi:tetratricopeptide (TPR) repeat protein